ncbi:hypothetical protein DPMN_041930 [Dreissena polymorpha]|uniref:Uncharacterized protein n=1 Tax=Dreissena polymorpha TaxID=45954 RepID=A0A9D4CXS4_DREPO|nr:hypothetical protein DPMN_041930 [Dreissena polymorpha]
MTGPEDATKCDEDSGDKDLGGNINNLTRNQLRADETVSIRNATGSVSNITDTNHSDTSQDESSDEDSVSDASDTTFDYDVQIPVQQNQNEQRMPKIPRRGRRRPALHRHWIRTDIPNDQMDRYLQWNFRRPEFFDRDWEHHLLFELFFDDEVCSMIREQTTKYTRHQGNHKFLLKRFDFSLLFCL